jgi:hypothetical protein
MPMAWNGNRERRRFNAVVSHRTIGRRGFSQVVIVAGVGNSAAPVRPSSPALWKRREIISPRIFWFLATMARRAATCTGIRTRRPGDGVCSAPHEAPGLSFPCCHHPFSNNPRPKSKKTIRIFCPPPQKPDSWSRSGCVHTVGPVRTTSTRRGRRRSGRSSLPTPDTACAAPRYMQNATHNGINSNGETSGGDRHHPGDRGADA